MRRSIRVIVGLALLTLLVDVTLFCAGAGFASFARSFVEGWRLVWRM